MLVLDEPTAHLDTATAQSLADDLLGRDDGRSVLWITHGRVGLDRMDRVLDLGERDTYLGQRVRLRVVTSRLVEPHATDWWAGQASTTTGMIIGRRRCRLDTQRPITRRMVCCSW